MSWSRFGEADVYTFPHVDGFGCCCMCSLSENDFESPDVAIFLAHLEQHREAGHYVPEWLTDDVKSEWDQFMPSGLGKENPQ